jgi:hypothetical protein
MLKLILTTMQSMQKDFKRSRTDNTNAGCMLAFILTNCKSVYLLVSIPPQCCPMSRSQQKKSEVMMENRGALQTEGEMCLI